jgi:hypothetical protein
MPTLVLDPQPPEVKALIERRRKLGQDRFDEVWDGVYHMNPVPAGRHANVAQQLAELLASPAREAGLVPMISQFNLGDSSEDFRIPDGGLHRGFEDRVFYATAALVIEIVSPRDETWQKLRFYSDHGVEELLIVDPQQRTVHWLGLEAGEYKPLERSRLIELSAGELAERIDWPA